MLNMDFSKRVSIETVQKNWVQSPAKGVNRKPLERESAENGHVTSIVQYFPGAKFPEHTHPLGEEIFVLEDVFSDEFGDYPAGTYIRNPPGSSHVPYSQMGCTIFVKLNQFDQNDFNVVRIDTTKNHSWKNKMGVMAILPLHQFKQGYITLFKWKSLYSNPLKCLGGEEILVLEGMVSDKYGNHPKGTWTRNCQKNAYQSLICEPTIIWIKTNYLPKI